MIEALESRIAPAALTAGGKLLTYTDIDGDLVKITFTASMPQDFFSFSTPFNAGDTTTPQALEVINLNDKTGISFTMKATPQKVGGVLKGDSHANIRLINAPATDLGIVKIDGDVLQITAGHVNSFTALSMGKSGGASGSQFISLGTMHIKTDIGPNAYVEIQGGVKTIIIGGSLVGTSAGSSGGLSIQSGGVRTLKIGGSLYANAGTFIGNLAIQGDVGTLSIGGSVVGGVNGNNAIVPQVKINGNIATLSVGGDLVGKEANRGGEIEISGNAGVISIGGSLIGSHASVTGFLSVLGSVRSIRIGHDIIGGNSTGGSLVSSNGSIMVGGSLGSLTVGGDFIAGRVIDPGGSFFRSGVIGAVGTVGTVKIGGNIQGNAGHLAYITVGGAGATDGAPALKSLAVSGSVTGGSILAGYDGSFSQRNLLAGIGSVKIGGNLEASFIIAGSDKGPDSIPGNEDDLSVNNTTKIGSVRIGGAFFGRLGDATNYYVYAPRILSFQTGHARYVESQLLDALDFSSIGLATVLAARDA